MKTRPFIAMWAMACLPAEASPLYSNFNVSMGFDPNNGWVADGGDLTNQVFAESFTSSIQATLTQIEVAMGFYTTGSVNPVLYLESDAAGRPSSGLSLDTLSAPPASIGPFPAGNVVAFACSSCPMLIPGATYWVVAQEPDPTSGIVWNLNTVNDVNNNSIVFNDSGSRTGPWTPGLPTDLRAVMEVDGTPVSSVPEPGYAPSVTGLIAGFAGLGKRLEIAKAIRRRG